MDARQSDVGVSLGTIPHPVTVTADVTPDGEALPDKRNETSRNETSAPVTSLPRPTPKWPAVALLGGVALSGLWVGLLVWVFGRWIGAI